MAWFRQKGKYWYYCYRKDGKELQIYIGDHDIILKKLLPKQKAEDPFTIKKVKQTLDDKKERAAAAGPDLQDNITA